MKKLLAIFCLFIGLGLTAQVSCEIHVPNQIIVCDTGTIQLEATGNNLTDVKWLPADGLSQNDIANPTCKVDSDITYVVVNRIPLGGELIVNGDFEQGNVGFTSMYGVDCGGATGIEPGHYCVNNSVSVGWPGWNDCKGHSTPGEDQMMIIDASIQPNVEIWCQSVSVNPNSTYQFSAWVTSVFIANPPILQFSINGSLIGKPLKASDTPCDWSEFFQTWESESNTTADICIVNQNTIQQGNDLAIDDISFREVCFSTDTVTIKVESNPTVELGNDTTICTGDTIWVDNKGPEIVGATYKWSDGSTQKSFAATRPATVTLEVSTPGGCSGMDSVVIGDKGIPSSSLIGDTSLCIQANNSFTLYAGTADTVVWTFDGTNYYQEDFLAKDTGVYSVRLSNGANCNVTDSMRISSECATGLFIENAFSPNGDGLNETFGPHAVETYDEFELIVYDRWGNEIFYSNNVHQHWNGNLKSGKLAPTGLYVYKLNYSVVDVYTAHLKQRKTIGHVMLIR